MNTRISVIFLSMLFPCSSTSAVELLVSPSRAKWERVLTHINESFGKDFLTAMEDFTGVQRAHDLSRSVLTGDFGIDPKIVSYCQYLVTSDKNAGQEKHNFRATVLIVETANSENLERIFKKLQKTTSEPVSVKPLVAKIFRDGQFIVLVIFDGVQLGQNENRIVSIIDNLCKAK